MNRIKQDSSLPSGSKLPEDYRLWHLEKAGEYNDRNFVTIVTKTVVRVYHRVVYKCSFKKNSDKKH